MTARLPYIYNFHRDKHGWQSTCRRSTSPGSQNNEIKHSISPQQTWRPKYCRSNRSLKRETKYSPDYKPNKTWGTAPSHCEEQTKQTLAQCLNYKVRTIMGTTPMLIIIECKWTMNKQYLSKYKRIKHNIWLYLRGTQRTILLNI